MTFKPKNQQIHVPGFGVVQKEDFGQEHFNALMKRAGDNRDAFIKQHLVVESYGDQPLFAEAETEKPKAKVGKKSAKAETDEEAELKRLIDEEEASKNGSQSE